MILDLLDFLARPQDYAFTYRNRNGEFYLVRISDLPPEAKIR